jgi:hypothetical protein
MNAQKTRRQFLAESSALVMAGVMPGCLSSSSAGELPADGFRSLFDGKTLAGWTPKPRPQGIKRPKEGEKSDPNSLYERALRSTGRWTVQDGFIVGEQDPPGSGLGGYLVSDEEFGDFELMIDARPDWPADTGVLVRTTPAGNVGFQVLIDHRRSGGIGGFYGNGLMGFHALPYQFTAVFDQDGKAIGLREEQPGETIEAVSDEKRRLLSYYAPIGEFLKTWKFGQWNTFKIRSVGELPVLTSWINGVKICEMDTAKIDWPKYDPKEVLKLIGRRGHLSLEVHNSGPGDKLGKDRWAPGAVCRWRSISIKTL